MLKHGIRVSCKQLLQVSTHLELFWHKTLRETWFRTYGATPSKPMAQCITIRTDLELKRYGLSYSAFVVAPCAVRKVLFDLAIGARQA